jgi:DinB superfamily
MGSSAHSVQGRYYRRIGPLYKSKLPHQLKSMFLPLLHEFDMLRRKESNKMTPEERNELIAKYAAGYEEVAEALNDFPAESLAAHPIPGKWSVREIIHHLGDSESTSAFRIRKLLVEDNAIIEGYDQDQFATRLRYNERDMAPALEAFRAARASTVPLLQMMTEEDWQRVGTHTESGRYTTENWLTIYAGHAHNHAAQIRRLREALSQKAHS